MAETTFPTVDDLVAQIRDDLDEAENADTNFWTNAFLIGRLNRGFREIWQSARETHENWFVRKLLSTDPPLRLYGRAYDPAQLALTADATELALPPDFFELLALMPIASVQSSEPRPTFTMTSLSASDFRALRQAQSTQVIATYQCDIERRAEGPRLLFAPTIGAGSPADVELHYVYQPRDYAAGDDLENSGFSPTMIDAAVAYAVLEAREREDKSSDAIQRAERKYARKLALVTRHAGPRESQDPELVDGGWMEDGI